MLIVQCPHCEMFIEVVELNCKIFRCGVYKETYIQIHPHLPKEECDSLVQSDMIYGCGRPFKIVDNIPQKCDYI